MDPIAIYFTIQIFTNVISIRRFLSRWNSSENQAVGISLTGQTCLNDGRIFLTCHNCVLVNFIGISIHYVENSFGGVVGSYVIGHNYWTIYKLCEVERGTYETQTLPGITGGKIRDWDWSGLDWKPAEFGRVLQLRQRFIVKWYWYLGNVAKIWAASQSRDINRKISKLTTYVESEKAYEQQNYIISLL